ncbi:MAG TPA: lysophospholipid acyltransferase family protein [Candidatus Berkiella sp.]|nr:lysophospholipid acyltransferase family protein [Candidatus Berkiella sp.]
MHPNVDPTRQYVYGFWHGKQFAPIMFLPKWGPAKHVGLVSASRDGEMLSVWLQQLGYHVVRGSSSRKAISSLVKLINAAKEGYSMGIAADGPRGPALKAKAGISFLAHKANLQVVPIGVAYSKPWQFKSWDKYQLPLPFTKAVLYFDEPISVNEVSDNVNEQMAKAIDVAELTAFELLKGTSKQPVVDCKPYIATI